MTTIGFLELNSIAKGIEAADAMLKAAETELVSAKASCPGKYYILISGDVAAVKSSIDAGCRVGENYVIDSLVIPRVHPEVVSAINLCTVPKTTNAAGIMEFYSVTASIIAADTAVKAANASIIDLRLGTGIGGKSFVVITGETAEVKSALEAAIGNDKMGGMVLEYVIISNPRQEIFESLL